MFLKIWTFYFPTRPTRNCLNDLPVILPNYVLSCKHILYRNSCVCWASPTELSHPMSCFTTLAMKYASHEGTIYFVSWLRANTYLTSLVGKKRQQYYRNLYNLLRSVHLYSLYFVGVGVGPKEHIMKSISSTKYNIYQIVPCNLPKNNG